MPTFKEICESVWEEANGRPLTLTSTNLGKDSGGNYYLTDPTQRNIVRWVNDVNLQIQQECIQADFMSKRGLFLTTVSGTQEYTKSSVREIDIHSIYAVLDGTTARLPVFVRSYDSWVEEERAYSDSGGAPQWLVRTPEKKWLVDPTPSAIYDIYATWWMEPGRFTQSDDEPIWHENFHDVIKWRVLRLFAAEFSSEGAQKRLNERVQLIGIPLEHAFKRYYVPSIVGASALM
jgi:hypothetical protein